MIRQWLLRERRFWNQKIIMQKQLKNLVKQTIKCVNDGAIADCINYKHVIQILLLKKQKEDDQSAIQSLQQQLEASGLDLSHVKKERGEDSCHC